MGAPTRILSEIVMGCTARMWVPRESPVYPQLSALKRALDEIRDF